jgi:hypothetical protein
MTRKMRNIIRYIACATMLLLSKSIVAQQYSEYEVKAVFIYNFAKFIDWPPQDLKPNQPFVIGIYGNDPFGKILPTVLDKKLIKDHKWIIKYYKTPSEIGQCQILFISKISNYELLKVFEQISTKATLSIGDNIPDFCKNGGVINFTSPSDKYRFEINSIVAQQASLTISSKLLSIAKLSNYKSFRF